MVRGFAVLTLGLLFACSSADDGKQLTSSLTDCTPNQTFPCTCGLDTGTQSCTADRKLTVCDCSVKKTPEPDPAPIVQKSLCGNGTVDEGEACDDGNTISGDGCSATCEADGAPPEAAACPGQAVTVWQGKTTTLAGTTTPFTDVFSASCGADGAKDRRYMIEPSADGVLTIEASFAPHFDAVVELNDDVCVNGKSLLCEDTFSAPFARSVSVVAHRPYYLLIDGLLAGDEGAYSLTLTLQ